MERGTDLDGTLDQRVYYHVDGLGSISVLTDDTGAMVQTYLYDSFGNIVEQTGTVDNPYTYTGREFDTESGLYYYRARYYDARVGRFLSEDPIGFAGGINFYNYAANSPINFTDPFGLWDYADEYGTTGDGLQENITSQEDTVDNVFNAEAGTDAIITFSINGTHGEDSLHYEGNAIDLRTRGLTADQVRRIVDSLRTEFGDDYDVINEGDHIHIEYQPSSGSCPQ